MDKKNSAPKFLEWLFRRFLRKEEEYEKLGDFAESYFELLQERSRFTADGWYLIQIIKAIPASVSNLFYGSITMLKNYLVAAYRNFTRNWTYSFLNVMGLAVGIAAFTLLGLYVFFELNHDKCHENADRVFKVIAGKQAVTMVPLAPALLREFPEVEAATRIMGPNQFLLHVNDREFFGDQWVWADQHLLDIFTFPLITGVKQTALKNPNSVVISEEVAKKYFGNEEPLGKALHWSSSFYETDFIVTGIMQNIPKNSHVRADIFASFNSMENFPNYNENNFGWSNYWCHTFLLLKEGQSHLELQEKYPDFLSAQTGLEREWTFFNRRLTDLHLRSTDTIFNFGTVSDIRYVYIFSAVALIILLIVIVNYINLTTALSTKRFQEVGIRKTVGAQRSQLMRQFLGESLLLTLLALVLAVVLAILLLPIFNNLIQIDHPLTLGDNIQFFMILLLAGMFVGLFAGIYPAVFMANFKPSGALKSGAAAKTKKASLRSMLVIIQFAISIFLIIGTLVTAGQLNYIRNKNLGFSKDHIIVTPIRGKTMDEERFALKQELLQYPGISRVSYATTIPMEINWHNTFYFRNEEDPENNWVASHYTRVDYDYIDLFELEIVKGRSFQKEIDEGRTVFIINEAVAQKTGWEDPVGKLFQNHGRDGTIVGMVKDFHNENMHLPKSEVVLILAPEQGHTMSIKINSQDIPGTMAAVEKIWNKFSGGFPFEYEFMDKKYDEMYKSEIRLGRTFNHFSVLAIFLCCLGLFGLASFTVEQGTKEIAVRKVLGASVGELIKMLSWKFLKWVIMANLLAWPIAYFVMNSWLKSYVYRINIGWGIFFIAGALATAIAFFTIIMRTLRAALANPADSLRYE